MAIILKKRTAAPVEAEPLVEDCGKGVVPGFTAEQSRQIAKEALLKYVRTLARKAARADHAKSLN